MTHIDPIEALKIVTTAGFQDMGAYFQVTLAEDQVVDIKRAAAEAKRHQEIDRMIETLRAKWHECHQLRLGQLISNVIPGQTSTDQPLERYIEEYPQ